MSRIVLTPRQMEVARLLLDEDLTQSEVAARLNISERTVWHHTAAIRKATGATTTAVALSRARARGLAARSVDMAGNV